MGESFGDNLLPLKILRKLVAQLLHTCIKVAKLRLRLRAGSLHLVYRVHRALHHGGQVLHVEPKWNDDERRPHDYLEYTAKPRTAAHRVEHAIVFFCELQGLLKQTAV